MGRQQSDRRWSGKVTENSDALDLEEDIFKSRSAKRIAASLKRSAEQSHRRKSSPLQSAMSMLNFYINRAGKNLPGSQKRVLEAAKTVACSAGRCRTRCAREQSQPREGEHMGREVELKLEVPPSAIDEVARLPWLSEASKGPATREELVTVYFDTAKSKLRKHGLTLRVRHAGENRVQTIKALTEGARGASGRDEWEERIAGDTPDLKLAKGTALEPLATRKLQRKLKPVFETVIERTAFPIHSGDADLELAVDRGHIKAREWREPVSEVEIELKQGDRATLAKIAQRLAQSAPVAYAAQSKPERGYALSAGESAKAVCRRTIDLDPEASTAAAFQTIAMSCLDHAAANERAVREGETEAVHQMGWPASVARGDFHISGVIVGSGDRGDQDGTEMADQAVGARARFRCAPRGARQCTASRPADRWRNRPARERSAGQAGCRAAKGKNCCRERSLSSARSAYRALGRQW